MPKRKTIGIRFRGGQVLVVRLVHRYVFRGPTPLERAPSPSITVDRTPHQHSGSIKVVSKISRLHRGQFAGSSKSPATWSRWNCPADLACVGPKRVTRHVTRVT